MNRTLPMLLLLLLASTCAAETANLLPNADLEHWNSKLPERWRAINYWGAPGQFRMDESEHHSGQHSFRISAPESTQSYLYSEPVPVAAGEEITARAWVKMRDVPPDGAVVLVANFFNGDNRTEQFVDVGQLHAKDGQGEWKQIDAAIKAPQLAETVRLRIGFRDSHGTCWIDDVSLTAKQGLVVRAQLPSPRLTPETGGIPALVINRQNRSEQLTIQAQLGKAQGKTRADVKAATTQRVLVPLAITERKTLPLEVSAIRAGGGKPLWVEKREVTVLPAMVLSPPIPTHWAIEDGAATIEGDADLAVTKQRRETSELEVLLQDASGKEVAKWTSDTAGGVKDGINHFELRPPALALGDYRIVAELKTLQADVTEKVSAEQSWVVLKREQSRVVLNANGYLESRGVPIFPLGIFNGNGKDKEMGDAGFTVQHAYNAANAEPGERTPDEDAKRFIDGAQKNGMMALFLIPRGLAFSGDWDGVRRRIRMFKNHPALLAWDEEEGIARGDMDMKALATLRKIIAEEDPNHPLMVGDSRDVITNIKDRSNFFPLPYMDLGMWWWYPIPPGAGKANLLEGDEKTRALELEPPSFLVKRNTDKPIWVGVQSYNKGGPKNRYPTPAEYRAQAYLSIIHGAKGLMWYGGSVEGGIFESPGEGHWDYVKQLARELRDLSPVFMAPTGEQPIVSPSQAPISVMLKSLPDRYVILAANRGAAPIDVTLASTNLRAGEVKVLTEERTLRASDQHLTDRFAPYQVHVYEWPTR